MELSTAFVLPMRMQCMTTLASSVTDDFANFAASLEEDDRKTEISDSVGSFESASSSAAEKPPTAKNKSWQEDLDELLNPMTPVARKQILLSDLAGANSDIQASIQSALRDGKVSQFTRVLKTIYEYENSRVRVQAVSSHSFQLNDID